MTFMALEVDAIWVIMIVCIAVAAISLFGLCRATLLEHRYYKARGRVRHSLDSPAPRGATPPPPPRLRKARLASQAAPLLQGRGSE